QRPASLFDGCPPVSVCRRFLPPLIRKKGHRPPHERSPANPHPLPSPRKRGEGAPQGRMRGAPTLPVAAPPGSGGRAEAQVRSKGGGAGRRPAPGGHEYLGLRLPTAPATQKRGTTRDNRQMHVTRLEFSGFRCFERGQLHPGPGLNLLVGPNGSGKTSVLEALHLMAYGRSFRGRVRDGLVRSGEAALEVFVE